MSDCNDNYCMNNGSGKEYCEACYRSERDWNEMNERELDKEKNILHTISNDKTKTKMERLAESKRKGNETIAKMQKAYLEEFLLPWKRNVDSNVKKRKRIKEILPAMVTMWRQGYGDAMACAYADYKIPTWNIDLRKYDEYAERKYGEDYLRRDNPMRLLKKSVRHIDEDSKFAVAEETAVMNSAGQMIKIQEYKRKREKEDEAVNQRAITRRDQKELRRDRITINVEKIQIGAGDKNRLEDQFKPKNLESSDALKNLIALKEQENKYVIPPVEEPAE